MAALPAALLALLLPAVVVSTPSQTNCTDGKTSGPCGPRRQLCGPLYADALPAAAVPRVHLHDRSCHLNDPSGPVWDPVHGFYHVFYQDHMARPEPGAVPGASQADGPVWGHWVSKDLVTFAQLDVALWNGAADGTDSFDDVGIYTGSSTVVDGKVRIVYPGLCNHGKGDCPDPKCAGGQTPSWANGDPHDCPSKNIAVAVPSNYSGDPLLRNWTKTGAPGAGLIVHGSTRDPSTAWQTAKGGEWRFMTFSGHVYRSHDFESWSSSNETLFPPAECPSLFKLPRDIRQASASEYAAKGAGGGGEGAIAGDVKGNISGAALPTHVYKGSGIHCLVNGQHAKCPHKDWFKLGSYIDGPPNSTGSWSPATTTTSSSSFSSSTLSSSTSTSASGSTSASASAPASASASVSTAAVWPQLVDAGSVYASKDLAMKDGRRVLFGWADGEPGQVMTLPRELLYDSSLMLILQRPIEELAELRTLPPLAQLGPRLLPPLPSSSAPSSLSEKEDQEKSEGAVQLFAPRPEGHFLEVVAVFERPTGRAVLWVDVFEPAGGGNGSTRVAIAYNSPPKSSANAPYNVTATVLADRCPGGSGQHPMKKPPKGACAPETTVLMDPADTTIELRVFADGTVVEAFFMGGRATLFARSDPASQAVPDVGASVGASGGRSSSSDGGGGSSGGGGGTGGGIRLLNCSAYTLKSIWMTPEELLKKR